MSAPWRTCPRCRSPRGRGPGEGSRRDLQHRVLRQQAERPEPDRPPQGRDREAGRGRDRAAGDQGPGRARKIFPEDKWQILIDDQSNNGQDLAIAVRLPFKIVGSTANDIDAADADFLYPADTQVNEKPFPDNRDVLFAKIAIPETDRTFVVMVHHAKSRLGGRDTTDPRRKLAAELIVSAIQTRFDGQDVILLGDMNDNPDDESMNILETGDASAAAGPDDVSDDTFLVNLTQPLLADDHVSWGLDRTKIIPGGKLETRVTGSRNKNNATRHQAGSSSPILFDQILLSRESLDRYSVAKVMVFDDPVGRRATRRGPTATSRSTTRRTTRRCSPTSPSPRKRSRP